MNARAEAVLDDPDLPQETPLELRVLEGEQRGAQAAVGWRSFEIGALQAGAGCEVQLRDAAIGDTRVRVTPRGSAAARLEVLAGEVMLGTQCLAAGSSSDWRLYAPLRIGSTLLAMGEPDAAGWLLPAAAHAVPQDDLVDATPAGAAGPAHDAEVAAPAPAGPAPAEAPAGRIERKLAIAGGAAVLVAALLLAMTHLLPSTAGVTVDRRDAVAHLLATQPQWRDLRVDAGPRGPVVHGELATNAQRGALQQLLAQAGLGDVPVEVVSG